MTRPAVLVTGSSGFIGAHLVAAFGDREVFAADLGPAPTPVRQWWDAMGVSPLEITLDVTDARRVRECLAAKAVSVVVHAAAVTNGPEVLIRRVNFEGTRHVLDATPADVQIVVLSSGSVYEGQECADTGHTLLETLDLGQPLRRTSAYASSKQAVEELACTCRGNGRDVRILRIAAAFGPLERDTSSRRRMSPIHTAIRAAVAGARIAAPSLGTDLTWAPDVANWVRAISDVDAERFAAATPAGGPGHGTVNVGLGALVPLSGLVESLNRLRPDISNCEQVHQMKAPDRRCALDTARLDNVIAPRKPTPVAGAVAEYARWLSTHPF